MNVFRRVTLSDGTRKIFAVDESGAEIGSATIEPGRPGQPAMIEVSVGAEHRSFGIGGRLMQAAFAEAGPGAYVWDHEDSPASQAIIHRLGLVPVRTLLQLCRWLEFPPLPQVEAPAGVSIRTYRGPEDDEQLLRVNNAAFDWHPEQGGWDLAKLRDRLAQPWVDADGIFLAVDEADKLLGFHWTRVYPQTQAAPPLGEVHVVGVHPAAHGHGLGRALTLVGLHHLRDKGLPRVKLYVEQTNLAARATYRSLGFGLFAQDVAYVEPKSVR